MTRIVRNVYRIIHWPTLLICGVSVFLISSVYPEIYEMLREKQSVLGVIIIFLVCILSIIQKNLITSGSDKIMRTYIAIGIVEILMAILQLFGILPSYSPYYKFTGSFRNPVVFAMMMATCLPISVYCLIKSAPTSKRKWLMITIGVSLFLLLSESRTGIISAFVSSFIIVFFEYPRFRQLVINRRRRFYLSGILVIVLVILYFYKRNSADGRILMWIVSLRMIADKPLMGWGRYGFSSSYMQYQANYFSENPNSVFSYLADNVSHPCNELLLVTVNYGIVGCIAMVCICIITLWMCFMTDNKYRYLNVSILLTIYIYSLFSYPSLVPIVWLICAFVICSNISFCCLKHCKMRVPMLTILSAGIICILTQNKNIYSEWKWKNIGVESSQVISKEYFDLYQRLNTNPSFLYNYGAWLHRNGYYKESLDILSECSLYYDDYNVELLLADNYNKLGNSLKAIEVFRNTSTMIPCRFLPLYHMMQIYKNNADTVNACRVAQMIIDKPIKIKNSVATEKIKDEANLLLQNSY